MDTEPPYMPIIGMVSFFGTPLCLLALTVWWLFFSGARWLTKLAVLGCVTAAGYGFRSCVRKVEFAQMPWANTIRIHLEMIWDPLPPAHGDKGEARPIDLTISPTDFPRYRGPNADGVSVGIPLATDWKAHPPQELWKQGSGQGYSGFAVAGDVAITMEQLPEGESVVCYDRANGRVLWTHSYKADYKDGMNMGDGPRGTPLIAGADVISLGATGVLSCLNGQDGKPRWSVNILDDCGAKNILWGLSGSPLLVGNLVVVNAGINPDKLAGMSLAAYDRTTGKRAWAAGNHPAGYSSPELLTVAGMSQIVMFDADGLTGHDPADGKGLWHHPWLTYSSMNIIQPLLIGGDKLFIASEPGNGCALIRVKAPAAGSNWSTEVVWESKKMGTKQSNPVTDGKAIYGLSSGFLVCLDAETGEERWKKRAQCALGQTMLRGDVVLVFTDRGYVTLVAADPKEYRELARQEIFQKKEDDKIWNTPALAGDQLFLRNETRMYCWKLPLKEK